MDDWDGRRMARQMGIPVFGTIGLLENAAQEKLIELPAAIARLRLTNFFASAELLDAALERDRGRKSGT
jgi:predicted nucleic acid-binding protein